MDYVTYLTISNIFLAAGALVLILWASSGFFTIHTMQAGVVERWSKFHRIATEGLNWKWPWPLESLVYKEDLSMQLMDVPVHSKTKDDATVTIQVRVQYFVLKDKVKEAYYTLDDPEAQIKAHVENVILAYIPKVDLDDAYQQEEQIAARIKDMLTKVMGNFGYSIENALVRQVLPADVVVAAMNDINAARREAEAAKARGEGEKTLRVKAAEADAEARRLQGEGIAKQRLAIIDGLKTSVEDFKSGTGVGTEEVLALVLLTQYFDMMRDIGAHSNTILMPHSPSAVQDLFGQLRQSIMTGSLAAAAEPVNRAMQAGS